jgi:Flp pilus assembly protein protease CpaA
MSVWVLAAALLLASALWTDLRRMEIPNRLTFTFAAAGAAYQMVGHGLDGLARAAAGAAAGMLPLFVLYAMRGVGGGDVKWFMAFGAWAGAKAAFVLLLLSVLFAGGLSILLLMLRLPVLSEWGRRIPWPWGKHPAARGPGTRFPFMLAVAPAFAAMVATGRLWQGFGWGGI